MLEIKHAFKTADPWLAVFLCFGMAAGLIAWAIQALDPNWHADASIFGRLLSALPPVARASMLLLGAAFTAWMGVAVLFASKRDNKTLLAPEKLRAPTLHGWRELRWEEVGSIEHGGGGTPFLVVSPKRRSLIERMFFTKRLWVIPDPDCYQAAVDYMGSRCPGLLKDVGTDPLKMSNYFQRRLALINRHYSHHYRRAPSASARR